MRQEIALSGTDASDMMPPRRRGWMGRAVRYLLLQGWKASPRRFIQLSVLGIVRSALPVGNLVLVVVLIDGLVRVVSGNSSAGFRTAMALGGQALLQIVNAGISEYYRLGQRRMSLLLRFQLEEALIDQLLRVEIRLVEEPEMHAVLTRIRTVSSTSGNDLLTNSLALLGGVLTVLLLVIFCVRVYWVAAMLVLVITCILLAISIKGSAERFEHRVRMTSPSRESEYWANLLINPLTALDIRAFGFGVWLKNKWRVLFLHMAQEDIKQGIHQDWFALAGQLTTVVSSIGLSGLLLWLSASHRISIGQFVAVGGVLSLTISSAQQLAQSCSLVYDGARSLDEFVRFMQIAPPVSQDQHVPCPELRDVIHIQGVTFRYPGAMNPALQDVSCTIPIGKRVLIVGPNGAGKSTLAKVIAGLYRPSAGQVLYDGVSGDLLSGEDLRLRISSLFQNYMYYDCTVWENIGFGDISRVDCLTDIEQASVIAGADPFIRRWANGYQTRLGRWLWDDGQVPSQGQRLRLALARTMFKQAQVYIFDEPTTGLDPVIEEVIVRQLDLFTQGKTMIMISHRLNLAALADKVIVLDQGRIIEEGETAALLKGTGWFASAYRDQLGSQLTDQFAISTMQGALDHE